MKSPANKLISAISLATASAQTGFATINYKLQNAATELAWFRLVLGDAPDSDFTNNLFKHGCWCAKVFSLDPVGLGGNRPVDELDQICKDWAGARRCTRESGASCDLQDVDSLVYQVEYLTDGTRQYLCPNVDVCLSETCQVDVFFLNEIFDWKNSNAGSFVAVENPECPVPMGQRGDGGSCEAFVTTQQPQTTTEPVTVAPVTVAPVTETPLPCASDPCQNSGTCSNSADFHSFTCDCSAIDFTGSVCETPMPCSADPCQNSGICNDSADFLSFTCDCSATSFFTGTVCETLIPCAGDPCSNGGVCSNSVDFNLFTCDCSTVDFTGSRCETPVTVDPTTVAPLDTPIAYDSDCHWIHGSWGEPLVCQDGYVLAGICGSGGNPDCDGYYHKIQCCQANPNLTGVNSEMPSATCGWVTHDAGNFAMLSECPANFVAAGRCGSGRTADCDKESLPGNVFESVGAIIQVGSWSEGNGNKNHHAVYCCHVETDPSTEVWEKGQFGDSIWCPPGHVITGACGSNDYNNCQDVGPAWIGFYATAIRCEKWIAMPLN